MRPVFRYLEIKLGPPNDHLATMLQVANQHIPHRHQLGSTTIQRQHDNPKTALQRRMLIKIVDHHLGNDIPLQLKNDSNRLVRLIARIADPLQLFLFH